MIWVLERSPSLPRILRMWLAAVCSEIESAAAIWRLVRPCAARRAT